ncbi:hypothetical protein OG21DRAFT_1513362 [Imleria badia]|nr:hypothetical protein OG21DRAFT_1513362 [Imleria badia]
MATVVVRFDPLAPTGMATGIGFECCGCMTLHSDWGLGGCAGCHSLGSNHQKNRT